MEEDRIDGMLREIEGQWYVQQSALREEQAEDETPVPSVLAAMVWPMIIITCGAFWVLLLGFLLGLF